MKKLIVSLTLLLTCNAALAYTTSELNCMAKAIYYEANVEPFEGKVAVGQVILNRTNNANRPKSICAVVKQPGQFTWYYPGVFDDSTGNKYRGLAKEIVEGFHQDITGGSEYFHRDVRVRPRWTRNLQLSVKIGNHVFYKERTA